MSNVLLRTISLTKKYGKDGGVVALDDVDLEIEEGEFVSIQGPSGSGKSTLLNCIGALDKPSNGQVLIDSKDISKMSENDLAKLRREKVGFIFQTFNLLPILNAAENVELAMENTGLNRKEMRERALRFLKTVGLSDRWNHYPRELSGGEKQRVAIARALANKPPLILADEPTGNLDSKTGKEIVQLLIQLNHNFNTTIVMVTHDPIVAKRADRQLYLEDGMIKGEKSNVDETRELMKAFSLTRKVAKRIEKAGYWDPKKIQSMDEREIRKIKGITDDDKNKLIKVVKNRK